MSKMRLSKTIVTEVSLILNECSKLVAFCLIELIYEAMVANLVSKAVTTETSFIQTDHPKTNFSKYR